MCKECHALRPSDRVSDFIALMERYHVHEAPVVDEKRRLIGWLHYKTLVAKNVQDPTLTKVASVMISPPAVKESEELEQAIRLIFDAGLRALPVIDENEKLVGIISIFDVIKAIRSEKVFQRLTAKQVMSDAVVIKKDEDIGKARKLMRDYNISRLPVIDEKGRLVGVVAIFDLLKAIKPKERISWYSMAAEKLVTTGIKVSVVMNDSPLIVEPDERLREVIDKMLDFNTRGAIVVENQTPIGVVTTRDLLEVYLASKSKPSELPIQLSGFESSDFERYPNLKDLMERFVEKTSKLIKIRCLHLHVKRYKKGKRTKFSVRARLLTERRSFIAREFSWNLSEALSKALSDLSRQVEKLVKGRKKTRRRALRRVKG